MAQPYVLKFGSVDLSDYVRVNPGDGWDIYGQGGFEQPNFSSSGAGEGQPLLSVDIQNRQMQWPLYLKATSKDLLSQLRQQIVREVRYGTKPLRVEWRDANASASTFYDVSFARLDDKFSYRVEYHNMADAVFNVWCQPPYGYAGTVASSLGSGANASGMSHIASFGLPTINGDVGALMDTHMSASGITLLRPNLLLTAVVPSGWTAYIPAASLLRTGVATLTGATQAAASQVVRITTSAVSPANFVTFTAPTTNPGRQRVLAVVKPAATPGVYMTANSGGLTNYGATSSVVPSAAGDWMVADLGVIDQDYYQQNVTSYVTPGVPSGVATAQVDLNALLLVPEDRTAIGVLWLNATGANYSFTTGFFGGSRSIRVETDNFNLSPDFDNLTSSRRGEFPQPRPGKAEAVLAMLLPQGNVTQQFALTTSHAVNERFTFSR